MTASLALAELRRVLTPGGRVIAAVDHPYASHALQRTEGRRTNYFETDNWTEEWEIGGQRALMSFWTGRCTRWPMPSPRPDSR